MCGHIAHICVCVLNECMCAHSYVCTSEACVGKSVCALSLGRRSLAQGLRFLLLIIHALPTANKTVMAMPLNAKFVMQDQGGRGVGWMLSLCKC